MANVCLLFKNSIYLQCLFPVAPDSSSYRVWFFQSARDVYYRFTLHYKKENLVVERNLGDFLFVIQTVNKQK